LIQYFKGKSEQKEDAAGESTGESKCPASKSNIGSSPSSCLILHEKLKLSREKFTPRDFNFNPNLVDTSANTVALIDFADFTCE
jgi:hypothetical protein